MKNILNFGAGVNSTALIIELIKRNMKPDYVVFADTGSEMPETYKHIERMKMWFEKNDINFIVVKSKYNTSVYDYFLKKRMTPSRQFRDCTGKFKIIPIRAFIKQFKKEGVVQYIGIGSDETYRIKKSDVKWIKFRYPLAEWNITREKCIKIIRDEGLEIPVKSGCFMCPFQKKDSWTNLLKKHPELFKKARNMEENGRRYPEITLTFDYNLKKYELAVKEQKGLNDFYERPSFICDGFCWS